MGVIRLPPRIKNEHNCICFLLPGHIVDFIFIFFLLRLLVFVLFDFDGDLMFEFDRVNIVEFVHNVTDGGCMEFDFEFKFELLLLLNILFTF